MAHKLKFHPRFISELADAIEYYDQLSGTADAKFRVEVDSQLKKIKQAPATRSIRYDNVRFARISKFPYAIHYSIADSGPLVFIHSLLCDFQDPGKNWQKRF